VTFTRTVGGGRCRVRPFSQGSAPARSRFLAGALPFPTTRVGWLLLTAPGAETRSGGIGPQGSRAASPRTASAASGNVCPARRGHGSHADLDRALPVDPGAASALTDTYPGGPHSARRVSVKSGQAPGGPGHMGGCIPVSGPHPCYGPDSAAHIKGSASPEKKLPLWEINVPAPRMGIPSSVWPMTGASNTTLPVNITPG